MPPCLFAAEGVQLILIIGIISWVLTLGVVVAAMYLADDDAVRAFSLIFIVALAWVGMCGVNVGAFVTTIIACLIWAGIIIWVQISD